MSKDLVLERKKELNLEIQMENAKLNKDMPLLMKLMNRYDKEFTTEVASLIANGVLEIDSPNNDT